MLNQPRIYQQEEYQRDNSMSPIPMISTAGENSRFKHDSFHLGATYSGDVGFYHSFDKQNKTKKHTPARQSPDPFKTTYYQTSKKASKANFFEGLKSSEVAASGYITQLKYDKSSQVLDENRQLRLP